MPKIDMKVTSANCRCYVLYRSKPFERSQSVHEQRAWSERGTSGPVGTVGGTSGTEDRNGAISPRKEQGRASTENWRSRGSENDETERWRGVGSGRSEKWGKYGDLCLSIAFG